MNEELQNTFLRLYQVVGELREKCPWDRAQTKESLRHLTLEEVYELSDSILEGDSEEFKKELGDVLLHILFYCRIGEESGQFTTTEMIQSQIDKLIFRHPHVYGKREGLESAEDVEKAWEQIKQKEREGTNKKTVLSGVPSSLPSLLKAYRIQEKVSNVGFDWDERSQVWEKVKEELSEFEEEFGKSEDQKDKEKIEQEFGDILFSLVNYARYLGINPEDALEKTNRKFSKRFTFLEEKAQEQKLDLKKMTLEEMDLIWEEAKKLEK